MAFCSTAMRLHYTGKRYPLHMRVEVYRTRGITSIVYGRNAEKPCA